MILNVNDDSTNSFIQLIYYKELGNPSSELYYHHKQSRQIYYKYIRSNYFLFSSMLLRMRIVMNPKKQNVDTEVTIAVPISMVNPPSSCLKCNIVWNINGDQMIEIPNNINFIERSITPLYYRLARLLNSNLKNNLK